MCSACLHVNERHLITVDCLPDPQVYQHTVRLFYMCSVSGVFKVSEVLYEARSNDLVSPFPFLQADLYNESVSQPGRNNEIAA